MFTWRDIVESLNLVEDNRLDDPAVVLIDGDTIEIDLIEINVPEIGDDRLVAMPIDEPTSPENEVNEICLDW